MTTNKDHEAIATTEQIQVLKEKSKEVTMQNPWIKVQSFMG